MYGHEGVSRDLTDRFRTRLTVALAALRARTGATLTQLPDPARVRPHFAVDIDIDRYPFIAITELDTPGGLTGSRGVQHDIQYTAFTYRYPFRVMVYVMGGSYGDTELQLKRYLTAMRMTLLDNLVLTENDDAHVDIDPSTISENFYAPEESATQVLGVGFVGVILESEEIVRTLPAVIGGTTTVGPFTIRPSIGAIDRDTGDPVGVEPMDDIPLG